MFYQLTAEKPDWLSSTGDTLRAEACRQLSIIYSGTATKFEANPADCANHREYLQKAYDMASEGMALELLIVNNTCSVPGNVGVGGKVYCAEKRNVWLVLHVIAIMLKGIYRIVMYTFIDFIPYMSQ